MDENRYQWTYSVPAYGSSVCDDQQSNDSCLREQNAIADNLCLSKIRDDGSLKNHINITPNKWLSKLEENRYKMIESKLRSAMEAEKQQRLSNILLKKELDKVS